MVCKRLYCFSLFICLLFGLTSCSKEFSSSDVVALQLRVAETASLNSHSRALPERAFGAMVALSTTESSYTEMSGNYEGVRNIEVNTDGGVAWQSPAYYPLDGSWIWLVGFSPAAHTSGGQVAYSLTGKEDLLYSGQLRGSRWDGERFSGNTDLSADRPLVFTHLLTRLQFVARKAATEGIAVKIQKIIVNEAPTVATLSLSTGQVVFSGAKGLSLTLPADGTEVSSTEPISLGELTLPPLIGEGEYTLTIETSIGTYSNVPIRFADTSATGTLQAGFSHKITFTLSDYSLGITSVQASPWATVNVNNELDLIQ